MATRLQLNASKSLAQLENQGLEASLRGFQSKAMADSPSP